MFTNVFIGAVNRWWSRSDYFNLNIQNVSAYHNLYNLGLVKKLYFNI